MHFNKNQIKAVSHKSGPAMVLAGPGSGKTTIITHRVKNLIKSGVSPEKILVVTFTKAAAIHMQKKFFHIMQEENRLCAGCPVSCGTFHSIFFKILKHTKKYSGQDILTENMKYQILREIVIRKKINVSSMNDFLQTISGEISNVKGNMINMHAYEPKSRNREDFQCIFREYEKELDVGGKIDFDDMLLKCFQLFVDNPEILKQWQKNFQYILVDEFQDINYVQYQIIRMLSLPENNLFVVGDDDQSIYGFRGSSPKFMFQFEEDFPRAEKIILNINYRSAPEIVALSEVLISHNQNRFQKNIQSGLEEKGKPDVKLFKNQSDQLDYLAERIKKLKRKGIGFNEMAILVRNNAQISTIQKYLSEREIVVSGGQNKKAIYQNMVAKDIINYVKASLNYEKTDFRENEEFIHILNKPPRYISRQVIAHDKMDFHNLKKVYNHSVEIKKNIEKLEFDLSMIAKLKPLAAIMYIEKGVGYENYLMEYAKNKGVKLSVLKKQMEEIKNDSQRYDTLEKWLESISEKKEVKKENEGKNVHIMTMHHAKGLEFEAVFIVDVNQGIIPSSRAVRNKDYEEERRVFYVAVTRAKSVLDIYAVTESLGSKIEPSMFLNEIINK